MREHARRLFVLTLALIALGAPSAASAQSDEEVIKQTLVEMWAAIETEDVARYAQHVHDDFSSFGETDTYLREGKAAELRGVESWIARYRNIQTEMHQPNVVVRGDMAWITYYWTDSSYSRATGERSTSRGKSTRVFVKENGRWLCIHGHYTLVA